MLLKMNWGARPLDVSVKFKDLNMGVTGGTSNSYLVGCTIPCQLILTKSAIRSHIFMVVTVETRCVM